MILSRTVQSLLYHNIIRHNFFPKRLEISLLVAAFRSERKSGWSQGSADAGMLTRRCQMTKELKLSRMVTDIFVENLHLQMEPISYEKKSNKKLSLLDFCIY